MGMGMKMVLGMAVRVGVGMEMETEDGGDGYSSHNLLPLFLLQSRNRDLLLGKEVGSRKQQKENTKQKTEQ